MKQTRVYTYVKAVSRHLRQVDKAAMGLPSSINERRTGELGLRMTLRENIGAERSIDLKEKARILLLRWVAHPVETVNQGLLHHELPRYC